MESPEKGRGIVLDEAVVEGAFVMEYEGDIYPLKERPRHEEEYPKNREGCFILDALTTDGWICIDATRHLCLVRLLNHASRGEATLAPFR